jgi:AcrR family transcriptional regulator
MTPRKPGHETLTRDRIVKAALGLVDEYGMEGHSMRDLALALGVDVSTLYYHVPNKAALYDLVADAVMEDPDLEQPDCDAAPIDRFCRTARGFRSTLLRHPNALPLLIGKPMRSPAQVGPVEHILGIFFDADFDATYALLALDSMAAYVLGCVSGQTGLQSDPKSEEGLEGLTLLPADEFANIHRMLTEVDDIDFTKYHDRQFEVGLDALARGLFTKE